MTRSNSLALRLINMAIFQVFWFIAVLGGNRYAIPFGLLALALHGWLTGQLFAEWRIVVFAVLVGLLVDSATMALGLVKFREAGAIAPLWLSMMWAVFATTLNHSLSWLHSRPVLAMVLGAAGGAGGYVGGAALGAAEIFDVGAAGPVAFALVYGMVWAIFTPVALHLAHRWSAPDGPVAT